MVKYKVYIYKVSIYMVDSSSLRTKWLRCGGAKEKPELRRSGDGVDREHEEEKLEIHKARCLVSTARGGSGAGGEVGSATARCRAATARGGRGGEAGAAAKRRRREVGCFPAHAADAASEGNRSDAEAWRDETNKLKERRRRRL